jgi:pyruvate dehydrogenase E1 component alpha subunit
MKAKTPAATPKAALPARPAPDALLKMYAFMQLTREFENTILRLYQQGKVVGGAYSGLGNEATAIGSAFALAPNDYLFPLHRDIGAHFVKGQSIRNMMMQHLGRAGNLTRGRDGTGHYADPSLKIYGNISHLGAMVPVACGAALASQLRKEGAVALTYIGDGGASIGEVHEGLMMASVMKLPFVLIIENNQYAYSTPLAKQSSAAHLADRAIGYGIPGVTIDGTDVLEVYRACSAAYARARAGQGPTIIESVTMRMSGHAAHDTAWYVPKELFEEWKKKDPVARFETLLLGEKILTPAARESMLKDMRASLEREADAVLALPYPPGEEAAEGVYADA